MIFADNLIGNELPLDTHQLKVLVRHYKKTH